jgi:adenosine/AMP kinase
LPAAADVIVIRGEGGAGIIGVVAGQVAANS